MQGSKTQINSTQSVKNLYDLLIEVGGNPKSFLDDVAIRKAVCSQHALANFQCAEKGIIRSSLNTMKRHAKVLDGGFQALDDLRNFALKRLLESTGHGRSKNDTKAGLEQRVAELSDEIQRAYEDLTLISIAFNRALLFGRAYAEQSGSETILALCRKNEFELQAEFARAKTWLVHRGVKR